MKELQLQETQTIRGGCCCKPTVPTNPGGGEQVVPPAPSKKCS